METLKQGDKTDQGDLMPKGEGTPIGATKQGLFVAPQVAVRALEGLVKQQRIVNCGCPKPRPNITYHKPACRYRLAVHYLAEFKVWGNDRGAKTDTWWRETIDCKEARFP